VVALFAGDNFPDRLLSSQLEFLVNPRLSGRRTTKVEGNGQIADRGRLAEGTYPFPKIKLSRLYSTQLARPVFQATSQNKTNIAQELVKVPSPMSESDILIASF